MIKINLIELRKAIYEETFMYPYKDKRECAIGAVLKNQDKIIIEEKDNA